MRNTRRGSGLARRLSLALAASLVGLSTVGTVAFANEERFWYFDNYGFADFHAQGIDGSGVKIAVFDTVINRNVPALADANITPVRVSGCLPDEPLDGFVDVTDITEASHGTNVVSLIVGNGKSYDSRRGVAGVAPGAEIFLFAQQGKVCRGGDLDNDADDIRLAVDMGVDIITMQVGIGVLEPEYNDAIAYAIRHNVIVIVAVGNWDDWLGPQGMLESNRNGILSVQALRPDGSVPVFPDGTPLVDPNTDVCAPGYTIAQQGFEGHGWEAHAQVDGSSFAAPWVAGVLALAIQKYPEATPHQILQSLIHNTGLEGPHEPFLDLEGGCGYGSADSITLLADDPTKYADVNPFVEDAPRAEGVEEWGPLREHIYPPAVSPAPETSASPRPSDAPSIDPSLGADADGEASSSWAGAALLIALAVLVIAAIVAVVTISVAKRREGEKS